MSRDAERPGGEFDVRPRAVLVHDPAGSGALAGLAALSRDDLAADVLFRAAPDPQVFARQHRDFVAAVERSVPVHRLADLVADGPHAEALRSDPNLVYTRDPLITVPWLPDRFLRAAMKPPIRRPETEVLATAARCLGLRELGRLPDGVHLEGGDVVPFAHGAERALLVGFGPRTGRDALGALADLLLPEHADAIYGIELADWRINLDGGLLPVAPGLLLLHRQSILSGVEVDRHGERPLDVLAMFRDLGYELVDVSLDESRDALACNCLCVGDGQVVCYDLCHRIVVQLRERGLQVTPVPGSELVKGTGGPRCMSRPIY